MYLLEFLHNSHCRMMHILNESKLNITMCDPKVIFKNSLHPNVQHNYGRLTPSKKYKTNNSQILTVLQNRHILHFN